MGQLYPCAYYSDSSSSVVSTRVNRPMSAVVGDTTGTMFTVTGTIPNPASPYIDVYLNGLFQQYTVDYTLDATGVSFVVTFTTPPASTDVPEAVY